MIREPEWKPTRRLAAQITIPVEPRVYERLAELALAEGVTRTEYVRAIIMRAIEPVTEVVT